MKKVPVGQRVFLSGIGLLLALIGAVFCALMWRSYDRAREMEQWAEVPCAILESEVASRRDDPDWPETMPQAFRFRVLYQYEWRDEVFESQQLSLRGASWSSQAAKAEDLVERYPRGSIATCLVNPTQPEQAVLEQESKAPGYSLWFPLLFVIGGVGIAVGAWRRGAGREGCGASVRTST